MILKGKDGLKIAVQCKQWKNTVGNNIILRLNSGRRVQGCYDAWVVTTSQFSKEAKGASEKLNIRLINGAMVQEMLNTWKKERKLQDN